VPVILGLGLACLTAAGMASMNAGASTVPRAGGGASPAAGGGASSGRTGAAIHAVLPTTTTSTTTTTTTAPSPRTAPSTTTTAVAGELPTSFACGNLPPKPVNGQQVTEQAQLGQDRAQLSGQSTQTSYGYIPALASPYVTVWLKGRQVYRAPLYVPPGAGLPPHSLVEPQALGASASSGSLCVARFTGPNPETAVLIGLYTGGAHCCTWVDAYVLRTAGVRVPPVEQFLGNPGGNLEGEATGAALITTDNAFYYEFDAYAVSGAPVRVLGLRGQKMVNLTAKYPALVTDDAKSWWLAFQEVRQPSNEGAGGGLGLLAAWVADKCVLGQGAQAWATVDRLDAEGKLTGAKGDAGIWPTGSKYVKALHTFLLQHGYCQGTS
jgi:hypothetical protein